MDKYEYIEKLLTGKDGGNFDPVTVDWDEILNPSWGLPAEQEHLKN